MTRTHLCDVIAANPRMAKTDINELSRFAKEICTIANKVYGRGKLNPAMLYITPSLDGVNGFSDLSLGYTGEGLLNHSAIAKKSFRQIKSEYPANPPALSIIPCKHRDFRVLQANEPLDFKVHFGSVHIPPCAILVENYFYSNYDSSCYSEYYNRVLGKLISQKNGTDVKIRGRYMSFLRDELKANVGLNLQPFVCKPKNRYLESFWGIGLINVNHAGLSINYLSFASS